MSGLSVLVITRNEEANIQRCLGSVTWADEIVVVDSGSTDRTVELARGFTPKVFVTEWRGFAATKAWGLERTSQPWVLWLDADEAVTSELAAEMREAIRSDADASAYAMPRKSFFLGRFIRHGGWYPGYVTRLFRRDRARISDRLVHEGLRVEGTVRRLRGDLLHDTYPTLEVAVGKLNRYASLAAEDMLRQGRRAGGLDLLVRPAFRFVQMYVWRLGFLDGIHGFVLSVLTSGYTFRKYAKLWEATKTRPSRADRGR